jgi:hypothetical protein
MAKVVYGLNLSLDGYVDHTAFGPGPVLFCHFIEQVRGVTGMMYGRRMYEVMRYWDRPAGLGPERTRLRSSMAEQAEVGGIALVEVDRPQRHTFRRWYRGGP